MGSNYKNSTLGKKKKIKIIIIVFQQQQLETTHGIYCLVATVIMTGAKEEVRWRSYFKPIIDFLISSCLPWYDLSINLTKLQQIHNVLITVQK